MKPMDIKYLERVGFDAPKLGEDWMGAFDKILKYVYYLEGLAGLGFSRQAIFEEQYQKRE